MFQKPSIYAAFQRFWFAQIQSRSIKYMASVFCPNWTHWVRIKILKILQKPSVYAGFWHFSQRLLSLNPYLGRVVVFVLS